MAIYKRKYKDKRGKIQMSKSYSVRFKDHTGVYHIIAGFPSKRATEGLESKLLDLVSCKIAGINLDKETEKWLSNLPQPIIKNLAKYGIIDNARVSGTIPLDTHIESFKQHLLDKGCSLKHINTIIPRIYIIVRGCNISNVNDLKIEIIIRKIADMTISEQTRKHYARALKQFSKWLYETNRTNSDLLKNMQIPKVSDTVRDRRALTIEEVSLLLEATRKSDFVYRKVNGFERYLIYRLAICTGLRANEIRTLKVSNLDFVNHTVSIDPKNDKSRRGAKLPLSISLSQLLKEFVSNKLPSARALNVPKLTAEMIRIDLDSAGIAYKTDAGYVDFHALRHTCGTILAQSGVAPQVVQRLMRHSDPRLTQNLYTHLLISDLRSGTEKFPDFSIGSGDSEVG